MTYVFVCEMHDPPRRVESKVRDAMLCAEGHAVRVMRRDWRAEAANFGTEGFRGEHTR